MQEAADVPRRASLRQRGVKSSGMAVDYDLNGRFRVQYENGVRPEGAQMEESEPEAPKERHPGGQVLKDVVAAGGGDQTGALLGSAILALRSNRSKRGGMVLLVLEA